MGSEGKSPEKFICLHLLVSVQKCWGQVLLIQWSFAFSITTTLGNQLTRLLVFTVNYAIGNGSVVACLQNDLESVSHCTLVSCIILLKQLDGENVCFPYFSFCFSGQWRLVWQKMMRRIQSRGEEVITFAPNRLWSLQVFKCHGSNWEPIIAMQCRPSEYIVIFPYTLGFVPVS